ncbi:penicillin-binding transpeptidase domain-containing protein [Paenibacillus sp. JX-17]|uniref:Penicillin-binding transpeptidase domain-containing protein n=1 Tax=Paenibacillus lacisoli TaxID=3064525 RepID=A0ABT9CHL0_9BACL|nr:penicillin-binding transpeptidase domain-containing protein [Paenibacillus sp. JX-17]MDO7908124.1 penicillin-binding transpeptidase domain-containing protein [Paenibacillus sp. JX-17]
MKRLHMRRLKQTAVFLTIVFIILILRLGWIQFIAGHQSVPAGGVVSRTLNDTAKLQQEEAVLLDPGRGQVLDRFGQKLTGRELQTVVLFPLGSRKPDLQEVQKLAPLLHTNPQHLLEVWTRAIHPVIWREESGMPLQLEPASISKVRQLQLDRVEVLPFVQRYDPVPSGRQWLGYLYEPANGRYGVRTGAAGMEKLLEPLLKSSGGTYALHYVSAQRERLQGQPTQIVRPDNPFYPLQIQTTIDLGIQKRIEQLTEKEGLQEGAIVVLDAATADVVAMVSRPFYRPYQVEPARGDWENAAVKAYAPGSIYKIVTAAAALEAGVTRPQEQFECKGEFGKYGLSCWKKEGHGIISLEEGFAESCNVVFAGLSERLSGRQLEEAAESLGLNRQVGWKGSEISGLHVMSHFDHEEKGRTFEGEPVDDGGILAQSSIGQRDTAMTPLQAANLVVTLLHGGQIQAPRLVERILYKDGSTMEKLPRHGYPSPHGRISPSTAQTILGWMNKVVSEGTGRSLQHTRWKVAGKSGTAQVQQKGRSRTNQWFIGYGPVEAPRYAAAVLVHNADPDTVNQATALFGQVMDLLASSPSSSVPLDRKVSSGTRLSSAAGPR